MVVPESVPHSLRCLGDSLKIRSCPVGEAVEKALSALAFLQESGCTKFYYKYCSTFDSSKKGNIRQVTYALMDALCTSLTLICPALPVNGRTVYKGYLFVNDVLLSDSPMRNHPITPMLDSKLERLTEGQFKGRSAHIFYEDMVRGAEHVRAIIERYRSAGDKSQYLIVDTLFEEDLKDDRPGH